MIGEQPSGITHIGKDGKPVDIQLKKKAPNAITGEHLRAVANDPQVEAENLRLERMMTEGMTQEEKDEFRRLRADKAFSRVADKERTLPPELSLPMTDTGEIEAYAAQLSAPVRKSEKRGEDNPQ